MKKATLAIILSVAGMPAIAEEAAQQSQEEMVVAAPSLNTEDLILKQDFDAIINSTMPMGPEQIREYKRIVDERKRAAAEPVRVTTPRSRQEMVDVAPGSAMPTISVNRGMTSSVIFLDRYGEPWPISYIKNGNDRDFTVEEVMSDHDKEEVNGMSNALTITNSNYSIGNVTVFLKGMSTPIVLTLQSGEKYTDVRVDLRVNRMGPVSKEAVTMQSMSSGELPQYDSMLLSVLGGVPGNNPAEYTHKILDNRIGDVYYNAERMFLRTGYKLLSPNSKKMTKSADGTIVYEIPNTPVVNLLINGSIQRVRVK